MKYFTSNFGIILLFTGFWILANELSFNTRLLESLPAKNQQYKIALQAPLTKEQVRHYIKSNVMVCKLQIKMKNQAREYDNVIQEFYKKRKSVLKKEGWTVEDFEETQNRIFAAQNGIRANEAMNSEADFKKEIAEVKNNKYLTEKQKKETIKLLQLDRNNRIESQINPTKLDWPTVEVYRKELEQVSDYCNGNGAEVPVVE